MNDYEAEFSRKQAVTATAISDNVVKVPRGDIGRGRPVVLQVSANAYTGAGTMNIELKTADTSAMGAAETIAIYPVRNDVLTKGGTILAADVPTGAKQYLQLTYTVSGSIAGGDISAGLRLHGDTATM